MMYDYLIVGAGLFGAVFAREMTDAGKKSMFDEDDINGYLSSVYKRYDDLTFITGHIPVQLLVDDFCVAHVGNLLVVDGGCAYGEQSEKENGILVLRLEDMKEFQIPCN